MLTKTRFAAFDEPEPLAGYGYGTAPTLAVDLAPTLSRIDDALSANIEHRLEPELWWYPRMITSGILLANISGHHLSSDWWSGTFLAYWPNRTQHVDESGPRPAALDAEPSRRAAYLDACLADLDRWLGIGLASASEAAGISRGTVYAWRDRGSTPRPSTVNSVLRVHGLVASAVQVAGEERARAWFHTGDPSPLTELQSSRGDSGKIARISRRLRRELIGPPIPPPNPLLASTVDDLRPA